MPYQLELLSSVRYGDGHYPCHDTQDGKKVNVGILTLDGSYSLFSEDGGKSWARRENPNRENIRYKKLKDGTFLGLAMHNLATGKINPAQKKIPCVAQVFRADSLEDLAAERYSVDFALIDIPGLGIGYGDSGEADDYHCSIFDHGLIQLENGDLIATMYGQFQCDKNRVDYFDKYPFYQYRSWCIRSQDNGRTWEFLSVIADTHTHPVDPTAEGYCEGDLLDLGGGHLLCSLRTMGHEVYTPLYMAHSLDSGKTWQKPFIVHPDGVFPRLLQTENGAILCASGKKGIFLLVSEDGYAWQDPFYVTDNDGQWDKGPSGYNTLLEVSPNEILLLFDETENRTGEMPAGEMRRKVYINRYRVTKY